MCGINNRIFKMLGLAGLAAMMVTAVGAQETSPHPRAAGTYVYEEQGRRDPFVQPQAGRLRNVMEKVNIDALKLTGVISSPQRSLALFVPQNGPQFGYLLKNERLYQENQQPVPGITGKIIGTDKVILRQDDKQMVFKLRGN